MATPPQHYYYSTTTSSSTAWGTWCNEYQSTATWHSWTSSTTDSSNQDATWYTWSGGDYEVETKSNEYFVYSDWVAEHEETMEQRRARKAQEEINRVEREERYNEQQRKIKELEKKKEKSENRAKELLLDLVGEEQMKIYNETDRLFVKGKKYDYVVRKHGHVKRLEKDKVRDLCIHLDSNHRNKCPDTDNVIALKLMIEADEKNFNKIANDHGVIETMHPDEYRRAVNG